MHGASLADFAVMEVIVCPNIDIMSLDQYPERAIEVFDSPWQTEKYVAITRLCSNVPERSVLQGRGAV